MGDFVEECMEGLKRLSSVFQSLMLISMTVQNMCLALKDVARPEMAEVSHS